MKSCIPLLSFGIYNFILLTIRDSQEALTQLTHVEPGMFLLKSIFSFPNRLFYIGVLYSHLNR